MLSRPRSPQQLTLSVMSGKGFFLIWPSCNSRMQPLCSVMKSLLLPSLAWVIWVGYLRPLKPSLRDMSGHTRLVIASGGLFPVA